VTCACVRVCVRELTMNSGTLKSAIDHDHRRHRTAASEPAHRQTAEASTTSDLSPDTHTDTDTVTHTQTHTVTKVLTVLHIYVGRRIHRDTYMSCLL